VVIILLLGWPTSPSFAATIWPTPDTTSQLESDRLRLFMNMPSPTSQMLIEKFIPLATYRKKKPKSMIIRRSIHEFDFNHAIIFPNHPQIMALFA